MCQLRSHIGELAADYSGCEAPEYTQQYRCGVGTAPTQSAGWTGCLHQLSAGQREALVGAVPPWPRPVAVQAC